MPRPSNHVAPVGLIGTARHYIGDFHAGSEMVRRLLRSRRTVMESRAQSSSLNVSSSVLVVDDEPLILWSVSETLRQQGYPVVECRDACGALDAVAGATSPFGVVLLDLRLPDCHDLSLLSRIRSILADAQIIVMTAHGTGELEQTAQNLGAYCVMHKPFGMTELMEKVRRADRDRFHRFPQGLVPLAQEGDTL